MGTTIGNGNMKCTGYPNTPTWQQHIMCHLIFVFTEQHTKIPTFRDDCGKIRWVYLHWRSISQRSKIGKDQRDQ